MFNTFSQVLIIDCRVISVLSYHDVSPHIDMVWECDKVVCDPQPTVSRDSIHPRLIGGAVNPTK